MASPLRVLLVEDDRDIREVLEEALAAHGYEVTTAPNGLEALQRLIAQAPPDAIVLDLMMPSLSGWELRQHLCAFEQLAHVPVIAMSALDVERTLAADFDAFVQKPLVVASLVEAIERTTARRAMARVVRG